jgi:hypothetical protein
MEEHMVGFLIGAVAVAGFLALRRHRRRFWHGYYGAGFGPGFGAGFGPGFGAGFGPGCHGRLGRGRWGGGGWHGRDFARAPFRRSGRFLYPIFREIDASPGQEKVISELVAKLQGELGGATSELESVRRDLAGALASPTLDEAALGQVFARANTLFQKLSAEAQAAFVTLHGSLDDEQRRAVASIMYNR